MAKLSHLGLMTMICGALRLLSEFSFRKLLSRVTILIYKNIYNKKHATISLTRQFAMSHYNQKAYLDSTVT